MATGVKIVLEVDTATGEAKLRQAGDAVERFGAKVQGTGAGAREAGQGVERFTQTIAGLPGPLGTAASSVGRLIGLLSGPGSLALAAIGAAAGLVTLAARAADNAERLANLARQTGLSAQALEALEFAATQAGEAPEGLARGFGQINLAMAQVLKGNREAGREFRALGVDLEALIRSGASVEQVIDATARGLTGIQDPLRRGAAEADLFGARSRAMGAALEEISRVGIAEFIRRMEEAGLITSKVGRQMALQLDAEFDRMKAAWTSTANFIKEQAAEIVLANLDFMQQILRFLGLFQGPTALEAFLERVKKATEAAALPRGGPRDILDEAAIKKQADALQQLQTQLTALSPNLDAFGRANLEVRTALGQFKDVLSPQELEVWAEKLIVAREAQIRLEAAIRASQIERAKDEAALKEQVGVFERWGISLESAAESLSRANRAFSLFAESARLGGDGLLELGEGAVKLDSDLRLLNNTIAEGEARTRAMFREGIGRALQEIRETQLKGIDEEITAINAAISGGAVSAQEAEELRTTIAALESAKRIALYTTEQDRRTELTIAELEVYARIEEQRATVAQRTADVVLRIQIATAKQSGDAWGVMGAAFQREVLSMGSAMDNFEQQARDVARAMADAFEELFFRLMRNEVENLGDIFTQFIEALQRSTARALAVAQMQAIGGPPAGGVAAGGTGGIGSILTLFGIGGSSVDTFSTSLERAETEVGGLSDASSSAATSTGAMTKAVEESSTGMKIFKRLLDAAGPALAAIASGAGVKLGTDVGSAQGAAFGSALGAAAGGTFGPFGAAAGGFIGGVTIGFQWELLGIGPENVDPLIKAIERPLRETVKGAIAQGILEGVETGDADTAWQNTHERIKDAILTAIIDAFVQQTVIATALDPLLSAIATGLAKDLGPQALLAHIRPALELFKTRMATLRPVFGEIVDVARQLGLELDTAGGNAAAMAETMAKIQEITGLTTKDMSRFTDAMTDGVLTLEEMRAVFMPLLGDITASEETMALFIGLMTQVLQILGLSADEAARLADELARGANIPIPDLPTGEPFTPPTIERELEQEEEARERAIERAVDLLGDVLQRLTELAIGLRDFGLAAALAAAQVSLLEVQIDRLMADLESGDPETAVEAAGKLLQMTQELAQAELRLLDALRQRNRELKAAMNTALDTLAAVRLAMADSASEADKVVDGMIRLAREVWSQLSVRIMAIAGAFAAVVRQLELMAAGELGTFETLDAAWASFQANLAAALDQMRRLIRLSVGMAPENRVQLLQEAANVLISAMEGALQANVALFDRLRTEAQEAAQERITALQAEIDAAQQQLQTAQEWAGVVQQVRDQLLQLQLGPLGPTNPMVALGLAQAEFAAALGVFQSTPTPEGAKKVAELAQLVLDEASEVFTRPSPEYQALFAEIVTALEEVQGVAEDQAATEADVVFAVASLQASITAENAALQATLEALNAEEVLQAAAIRAVFEVQLQQLREALFTALKALQAEQADAKAQITALIGEGNSIEAFLAQKTQQQVQILRRIEEVLRGLTGFQAGTPYVQQPTLGVLHEGEAVLTAAENRRRREGRGDTTLVVERGGIVVSGVSDPEAAAELAVRKLETWLSRGQGRARVQRIVRGRS